MASPEPDSATIDAWLAGELPEEEAAAIEHYFDEHPECMAEVGRLEEEDYLENISTEEAGPRVNELINRIKTNHPSPETLAPSKDAWREVLTTSENPELLGMIGDYEVLEVIATGGMGIVFKARDPKLDRVAALKVLAPDLAINATARERFLREAKAAARLEHENILSIFGVHEEGIPYFAMRHASGGTLQERLDAGESFGFEALKSIARQVASALSAAHEHGLIHRDIKPANILFDTDGEHLWVCDFGIARSTEDPSLTYPGAIAGTPQFMSPEQAAGGELDGRSDLFSLGAVLHRCSTGLHAFAGETTAAVLGQLGSNQPTSISPPKAKLPTWFERLLENLLAKDPPDRPRNAEAVIRAIDDEFSPKPKHTARRNRRLAISGATVGALGLLIFGLLQLPGFENTANAVLGFRHGQSFTIADRIGAWDSLKNAVAAARDGETIELPTGQPIDVGALRLASGKFLTFAPMEPGTRPILTTDISGEPGITSRSPIRFVGLEFNLNPGRNGEGIIVMDDAAVRIENCRFVCSRNVRDPNELRKPGAIDLRGNASVEIEGCEFLLEETNVFNIRPAADTRVSIRNSRIASFFGIDIRELKDPNGTLRLEMDGTRFRGQSWLKVDPSGTAAEIDAAVSDCEFVLARPLCWFETDVAYSADRDRLRWKGEGNTFPLRNAEVQYGAARPVRDAVVLAAIERFSGEPFEYPGWSISNPETGERFNDFSAAFSKLPAGSTIELSGEIHCLRENLAPRDKHFHLRSAPGGNATVVIRDPKAHAIFLYGPSTVSGIRFVRTDSDITGLPILGLRGVGADVLVEDCEFDAAPSVPDGTDAGRGLSLTDVGTATVRRCIFRAGRGVLGAFVSSQEDPPVPAVIELEDCVFIGYTAIQPASRTADTHLIVKATRCVFANDYWFARHPDYSLRRVDFEVTDSILNLDKAIFRIGRPFESEKDKISWVGKGNFYRKGAAAWVEPDGEVKGLEKPPQSTALDDLESFFRAFPEVVDDSGGRFGTPFERARLLPPVMLSDLREALDSDVDSPALETLELLAKPDLGSDDSD